MSIMVMMVIKSKREIYKLTTGSESSNIIIYKPGRQAVHSHNTKTRFNILIV